METEGRERRVGPDPERTETVEVLLVDGDPESARRTASALETERDRFNVETVASAEDGEARLAERAVDCVVSDYDLPGRDGIEFLSSVRETHPALPFVLFTGTGSEAVAERAIEAGVTGYLRKGLDVDRYAVLASRVESAVTEHRAGRNYRELFEKVGDGIKIIDPETYELLDANRRFCDIHGYSLADLRGAAVEEYIHEEATGSGARDRIDRAAAGEPQVFESINETKTGESIPVEVRLTGTRIDGRDRVLGVVRDISDRKRRERRLEEATDRTELALKGSDSWLWEWNVEEDWVVQSAVSNLLEGEDDRIERPVPEFVETIHPDDREGFRRAREEAIEEGGDYHVQFRLVRDGEIRWIESRGELYPGTGDTPDRIIGIATDITERKRHERERQWMQNLLDWAEEGVFVSDPDTADIQYVNDTACRLLGYDREQLLERSIIDIQSDIPDATAWDEHVARLRETEGVLVYEGEHVRSDGSRFPVDVRAGLAEIDGTEYVFGVVRDVTHRKERERELERQNERLEAFAQTVSHDLQTPLSVAAGSIELAREGDAGGDDGGTDEHLDRAADALERMEGLIERLLALARKGQTVEDPGSVELSGLAHRAWENVATDGAELSVDVDRSIVADEQRLLEVFENLFHNAVEHGGPEPDAGDPLRVRVGPTEDGFYVEDNGPGIPEAVRDRLFEAGYTTATDGTGLGLAIVEEIAQAHGWTVSLDGDVGSLGGTTFVFGDVETADGA